jgi:hypothetical protein
MPDWRCGTQRGQSVRSLERENAVRVKMLADAPAIDKSRCSIKCVCKLAKERPVEKAVARAAPPL